MADRLKQVRESKGVTQQELADRCDVSRMTVYRWENEGLPEQRYPEVAEALEVDESELREGADGRGRVVASDEDHKQWMNQIATADLPGDVKQITSYLPVFLNEMHWIVSVTPETMAEETNTPMEIVEQNWEAMLETEFVERIGPAEYVLELVIPEE